MDLNKLYKEIEEAEVNLNAKRLKYIKEALTENGGVGGTARVRRSPPWHEVSLAVCGQAHILIR